MIGKENDMNGMIRTTAWAGVLFSLLIVKMAQPQLANTPWPMFQHDPQHTGRSPYAGPDTVAVAWTFETDEIVSAPTIGDDGTIYVLTRSKFIALNPNGSAKWEYSFSRDIYPNGASTAVCSDGTIVTSFYDNSVNLNLIAFRPNGTIRWQRRIGGVFEESASSPLIGPDGTIYVGSKSDTLYAINQNGTLQWIFGTGKDIVSSPAMGSDGTIYVASTDGYLYAVSLNGTMKWKFQKGGGITVEASPAIGPDGTIYVGSYDRNFYAIKPDGTLKWKKGSGGNTVQSSPAIGIDGTIYIGLTYSLKAINPDGTEQWSYRIGTSDCTPTIDSVGTIYAPSDKLFSIKPDGHLKWSYDPPEAITTSVAIGRDGDLYFGARIDQHMGKVYRLAAMSVGKVPDLVISELSCSPQLGSTPGGRIKIGAYIRDLTGVASARCKVTFYYDDKTHLIGTTSAFVPISDFGFAQIDWPTQNFEVRDYKIIAVISNADPAESDTTNNEAAKMYPLLPTIQPRINSAQPGDTVWIEPGSYFENITLKNGVVVKSRLGPKVTIIDGRAAAVVVNAANLDRSAVLEGFTITNGKGSIITGGGINLDLSAATIRNNIISGNDPYGIWHRGFQSAWVEGNLIIGNKEQGFGANNSQTIFINNTVVGNPEGVHAVGFYVPSPVIVNCIFWDNGQDLAFTAAATYSDIQDGDPGTGNISADPLFIDSINDNYHLQAGSPCIDKGDPGLRDPDRTRSDMGAYYYDQSLTSVDRATDGAIPEIFVLLPNYPNPFNPETTIKYQLPKTSEVSLLIYNLLGQLVTTLVDEKRPAGYYTVRWNGTDQHGQPVASGVYLYKFKTNEFVQTRKMILTR